MRLAAAACIALVCLSSMPAHAAGNRWASFPEPAADWEKVRPAKRQGCMRVNGIDMHFAVYGEGSPVLLIHGGLANAGVWEAQVAALAARHQVIVADSRGHGRSTRAPNRALSYRQMADDYVGLLDGLGVDKAALVGWSDGAVIGLDIAMRHPGRLTGLFAHAANFDASGLTGAGGAAWGAYESWARASYRRLAGARCGGGGQGDFDGLKAALRPMWRGEPRWTAGDLARIAVPTAVVTGDRDEAIRCGHTKRLAAAIPGARLMILPGVGHFALRQDAAGYNAAILSFLDGEPPPRLGDCR